MLYFYQGILIIIIHDKKDFNHYYNLKYKNLFILKYRIYIKNKI